MERHVEPWVLDAIDEGDTNVLDERILFADRIRHGLDAVRDIVGKV